MSITNTEIGDAPHLSVTCWPAVAVTILDLAAYWQKAPQVFWIVVTDDEESTLNDSMADVFGGIISDLTTYHLRSK